MKIKDEIEELNAKFEHLQYRFDNLRDYVKETPPCDYYWKQFVRVQQAQEHFDKNSVEFIKLNKAGWLLISKYLDTILKDDWND